MQRIATPTLSQSVIAYFRLWRYDSTQILVLFLFMYFGWVGLAGGLDDSGWSSISRVVFGWAAATAILLAIFLINDAADKEIDRIVHPERPIPQGVSAWQHIAVLGVLLLFVGIGLSFAVNLRSVLVAVAMMVIAVLHYGYMKTRLPIACSSEIITPIVSALFPLYALSVAEFNDWAATGYLLGFIYFTDLAQDLLGGIHDEEGDRRHGVKTFALAIGGRRTVKMSLLFFLLGACGGLLLYLEGHLGLVYLAVFVGLTLFMFYRYLLLFRASEDGLRAESGKLNHLGGGYFFVVSASTFLDFVARRLLA